MSSSQAEIEGSGTKGSSMDPEAQAEDVLTGDASTSDEAVPEEGDPTDPAQAIVEQPVGTMPAPKGGTEALALGLAAAVVLFAARMTNLAATGDLQQAFTRPMTYVALGLFAVSVYSFYWGTPRLLDRPLSWIANWLQLPKALVVLLLLSPFISFAAWVAAGDSRLMWSSGLAIGLWLLSMIPAIAAGHPAWPSGLKRRIFRRETLLLAGAVLLAAVTRAYDLEHIPWVLTGDEGSVGLSAADYVKGVWNNIFHVAWYSFPSFFFIIPATSIRLLGQTIEAVRLPSAIAGVLTVPALYFFARRAFGRGTAIVSALYLAAFHFHIHFSRIALNNIWDGLFITLFSGLLWAGWISNRRFPFALAGLCLGVGMYFYSSFRAVVPMLGIWLLVATALDRSAVRQRLPSLFILGLAAIVVVLPLAAFYARHPQEMTAPYSRFSLLGQWLQDETQRTGLPAWRLLWTPIKTSAMAFTSTSLRHWYDIEHPMLLPIPATLFLLGLIFLLFNIRRLPFVWLALWLLVGVLAGGLSESTPAAQRYVVTTPAVALTVGMATTQLIHWVSSLMPKWRSASIAAASGVLLLAMGLDLNFYFRDFTPRRSFSDNNTFTAQRVAAYLSQTPGADYVYFLGPPRMGYATHSTLPYLSPDTTGTDVAEPLSQPPDWPLQEPTTTFIVLPERGEELEFIRQAYPGGATHYDKDREAKLLFIAYTLNHASPAPP